LVTKVEARNRCGDDVTIVIKEDLPIVVKSLDHLETGMVSSAYISFCAVFIYCVLYYLFVFF
jgi:hypothetical protein